MKGVQAMARNTIQINNFTSETGFYAGGKRLLQWLMMMSCIVGPSIANAQTWQQKLENSFDIVETFDQLQDWSGKKGTPQDGEVPITRYPKDFPVKVNGEASIWEYYSYWRDDAFRSEWIKNHGSDNVWQGQGKSLCLDYGGIQGPNRIGFHIGDSPDDGYPDEVYVFFMNKYHKDFFPKSGEKYFTWIGFLKTFEIATGFRDIWNWGTVAEQSATDHTEQPDHLYGMNFIVNSFQGTGDPKGMGRERCFYTIVTAKSDGKHFFPEREVIADSTRLDKPILNNEWFGLEYHLVKSSPAAAPNGSVQIWVYDQNGNVLNSDALTGIINFRNGLTSYKHSYNKFVWGGNRDTYLQKSYLQGKKCYPDQSKDIIRVENHRRATGDYFNIYSKDGEVPQPLENEKGYFVIRVNANEFRIANSYNDAINNRFIDLKSNGSGTVYVSCISHLYIDDIIVDDNRIGPKYFELLFGRNHVAEAQSSPISIIERDVSKQDVDTDVPPIAIAENKIKKQVTNVPVPPVHVTEKEISKQPPDTILASTNITAPASSKDVRPNLSNVQVYLDQTVSKREDRCVVFKELIASSTIKILDQSDQLIYELENYQSPTFYWFGFDLKGNKISSGEYHYEITCGTNSVVGIIQIEW